MSGFNHQPFLWPQSSDPSFPNVVFLSSMTGVAGDHLIVDESSYAENRTLYDSGVSPNRSYLTADDAKFYGTSMKVEEGSHAGFTMVETRFARPSGTTMAVEGWIYPATRGNSTATPLIVDMFTAGNPAFNLSAYALGADDYTFREGVNAPTAITHVKPADGFIFVQILVDSSDIMRLYMDATLKFTSSSMGNWNAVNNEIRFGGDAVGGGSYNCVAYFNEWRITIGGALRPATVPTGPFPRY